MKKILFFLLFLVVLTCNKSSHFINEEFVNKISINQDASLPSAFVKYNLYVKVSENSILETNVKFLSDIYNSHFKDKYKDFRSFLDSALNQNLIISVDISSQYEYGIFNIDNKVVNLSSKQIINKYLKVEKNNKYYFYPKQISASEIRTILYKLFLDNYLISFDDYGGKYIITKNK